MEIHLPDDCFIRAVESAAAWYQRSKINDVAVIRKKDALLERGSTGASPTWGRFYDIKTNRPIFVGRDGEIKYSLAEIEYERRFGYSYIRDFGAKVLAAYPTCKKV